LFSTSQIVGLANGSAGSTSSSTTGNSNNPVSTGANSVNSLRF
jgi:hypothetical protein